MRHYSKPIKKIIILLGLILLVISSVQIRAEEINYDQTGSLKETLPFIWSRPDNPYLTELKHRYQLKQMTANCSTDYEKIKVINAWVNGLWEHNGINIPRNDDPISIIEEARQGKQFRCVEYAIVLSGSLNAIGIPSRVVGLRTKEVETELVGAGHVVADAYLQELGKWIMIDGQWGVIPTQDEIPLNAVELQQALQHDDSGLSVDAASSIGVDAESYFRWIKDYLYYFDVSFDNRVGLNDGKLIGGSLTLIPEGAIRPERFQFMGINQHQIYTHSLQDFYPEPTTEDRKIITQQEKINRLLSRRWINYQQTNIIGEILIEGLTRTDQEVVRRQLPYRVGDKWTEDLKELTEQRLSQLNIFNPFTLRVEDEMITDQQVRVIISAEDCRPLMVNPASISFIGYPLKFTIFRMGDLLQEELRQRIFNPGGNGLSISLGINWSSEPWQQIGLDYAGAGGRVWSWEYKVFDRVDGYFNKINYLLEGYNTKFAVNFIPVNDWQLGTSVSYHDNTWRSGNKTLKQEYLFFGAGADWLKQGEISFELTYGDSLQKSQPDFLQVTSSWEKTINVKEDKILTHLSGGLSSRETPLNFQFKGGGFSQITLRGHQANQAGNNYLAANIEYHKLIAENLFLGLVDIWGVSFIDAAQIILEEDSLSDAGCEVDGGLGLSIDSALGVMRVDAGFDNLDQTPIYYLTFQTNF